MCVIHSPIFKIVKIQRFHTYNINGGLEIVSHTVDRKYN